MNDLVDREHDGSARGGIDAPGGDFDAAVAEGAALAAHEHREAMGHFVASKPQGGVFGATLARHVGCRARDGPHAAVVPGGRRSAIDLGGCHHSAIQRR